MACFHPLEAWQLEDNRVVFVETGPVKRALSLPCGQCVGCRLERSRQWAVRCVHESQMHEHSSFVTLTYEQLSSSSLVYRDFQLFMKRLRASSKTPVRFFMAGEYGEDFARPHFHALLFGVFFQDRVPLRKMPSGAQLYRSARLEALWPHGFSSVGDVTFESAAYVARYVMKKITGDAAGSHYESVEDTGEIVSRVPEFCRMSLKPGIGATWFEKYRDEVFPIDQVVVNGVKMKPPRYYDKFLAKVDAPELADVEFGRFVRAAACEPDNSPERLAVREVVTRARLSFKKRSVK